MSDRALASERVVFASAGFGGVGRSRFCGWGLLVVLGLLAGGLGVASPVAGQAATSDPAGDAGVSQVAAESVEVTVDDKDVAATKMTDGGTTYYTMKFGDWTKVTLRLKHVDEDDGDAVKYAAFGRDGVGPVVFDVWQRDTRDTVTAVTAVGADSTGLFARCGDDGTQNCSGGWSTTFYREVKTDSSGKASFYIYAPDDPEPDTAGTVRSLLVRAWEKVNGPAASGNTNSRLHYFYVLVSEDDRDMSEDDRNMLGPLPTTTLPAGNKATGFTVTSYGAKADKELSGERDFVEAEFGDEVGITVQLTDSDGADTRVGEDGSSPAKFLTQTVGATNFLSRVARNGATMSAFGDSSVRITDPVSGELLSTGADGSVSFAMETSDPDSSNTGSRASVGFIVRARDNAPGFMGDDATTAVKYGIIRFTEPPAPPTTTTTTTTTTPAESVKLSVDDATIAGTKMTDSGSKTYYLMKFGDWSKITLQLQHTDENDNNEVKNATVGRDGVGPVVFDVWQRDTRDTVTAVTAVGADSTGLFARCGDDGRQNCSGGWSTTFYREVKTDGKGEASFYVYAPDDPAPDTAGTVRSLLVRAWEKVNGPAASGNTNSRLHYFYVLVSEDDRDMSEDDRNMLGPLPTTTLPAGNKATGFTVTSYGAKADRVLSGERDFVEAEFGDEVGITVQLTDSEGADTTVGKDGKRRARFLTQTVGATNFLSRVTRNGATMSAFGDSSVRITAPVSGELLSTGADGSVSFAMETSDPDTTRTGSRASVGFIVRARNNAPGVRSDTAKTAVKYGIIRFTEPPSSTTTVPADKSAAGFTVMSYGAKTDKELGGDTSFVEAKFGDAVGVTVQLKDAEGNNTNAGADGVSPATFKMLRVFGTEFLSTVRRSGEGAALWWGSTIGSVTSASEVLSTGAKGSVDFAMEMSDHDTSTAGTEGSIGFIVRAGTNAPGSTGDDATTAVKYGIVRFSEPPAPTTTTTSSTTTTTPAESVKVMVDDAMVAAKKMSDASGTTYYEMGFGDWSKVTIQLQHVDENDGDKLKDATVGKDGVGPVVFDVWQRDTRDTVTAVTGVGATSTALFPKCGVGVTRDCSGGWATTFYREVKTDSSGTASFYIYAPDDPAPDTAGTVRSLLVRVWEKVNGPASASNPNTNKRLHYFYVRVTERNRITSGSVPATTVPSGEAAAGFTVTSYGAKTDKELSGERDFVEAAFGGEVGVTVQLKDANGANTTAGMDGTSPASFVTETVGAVNYITRVARRGATISVFGDSTVRIPAPASTEVLSTGADGSVSFSMETSDHDTSATGSRASVGFIVRARNNAPGATGNDATTTVKYGIIRFTEPPTPQPRPVWDLTASPSDATSVTLKWKRPSAEVVGCELGANAEYSITVVRVADNTPVRETEKESKNTGDTLIDATITGLSPGVEYVAYVAAYSESCDEHSANVQVRWTQPAAPPGGTTTTTTLPGGVVPPVRELTANPSGTSVELTWKRPATDIGGCALEGTVEYSVTVVDVVTNSPIHEHDEGSDNTGDKPISYTVNDLSPGALYVAYIAVYSDDDDCDSYSVDVQTEWTQPPASTTTTSTTTTTTTTSTTTTTTPATTTTVALSVADVTASEDSTFTFTVTATPAPTSEVTFRYTVTKESSDTAVAGSDFTAVTTPTATAITANASTVTITVTVTDDDLDENDETFTVTLSDASPNATISDTTATGTISDDDNSPVLNPIAAVSVKSGQAVDIIAAATDADGDTVTYAWSRKADETTPAIPGTPDLAVARLMFTPPDVGTYTMTVTASDGNGNTDTETVVITVTS